MSTINQSPLLNDPDVFPRLNEPALREWAKGLAQEFHFIRKIVLYQYSPIQHSLQLGEIPAKYAVVLKYGDEIGSFEKKFIGYTGALCTVFDSFNLGYLGVRRADWDRVYKEKPKEGFLEREWIFRGIKIGTEVPLGILAERNHWVLSPIEEAIDGKKPNVSIREVLNEANQILAIYHRLRESRKRKVKPIKVTNEMLIKAVEGDEKISIITNSHINKFGLSMSRSNLARDFKKNVTAIVMNDLFPNEGWTAEKVLNEMASIKKGVKS